MNIGLWLLAAARLWALLRVQVLWRRSVGVAWELVAAVIALAFAPLVFVSGVAELDGWSDWVLALGFELILGTVLGLVASLPGHALIGAIEASGKELGLSRGPASNRAPGARGFAALAIALALAGGMDLGLHQPLVHALSATTAAWPVGAPERWAAQANSPDTVTHVAMAGHSMLLLALALATPVLLSLALVDLASRTVAGGPLPAPALVDAIRPWARASLALIALGASWASFPEHWAAAIQ